VHPRARRAAASALTEVIARLRAGQRQRLVIGVGHGAYTCEGAAFEYTFNVEHELRSRGLRELADVVYLTNEYELGDFGLGGKSLLLAPSLLGESVACAAIGKSGMSKPSANTSAGTMTRRR
jgi:hypothetical protein